MSDSLLGDGYALLDTGGFMKLERLGDKTVARPSSLCMWKRRRSKDEWAKADATFTPGKGWSTRGAKFESWEVAFPAFKLRLRLQDNGQVGLFPEHTAYLEQLLNIISSREVSDRAPLKVLNLFAFTGMASVMLSLAGCEVCHVDLSKKALTWAKENFLLNSVRENSFRLIPEESVTFLERENRRENSYDLVLIDPPSFSRSGGGSAWKLEDVIFKMLGLCWNLVADHGLLVFSCHHAVINSGVLKNLALDLGAPGLTVIEGADLSLRENGSERVLPAGSYILCRKQSE